MKKRFLNLFLVMLMVVCVLPIATFATEYAGETCTAWPYVHEWTNGRCDWCDLPCAHTEYKNEVCTVCGTKCEHNYVNKGYKKDNEPTCQKTGVSILECSICGNATTQTAPVVKCKAKSVAKVEPTCTTPGKNKGTECKYCGKTLTGLTEIPALGHAYVNQGYKEGHESTCLETGIYILECSVCHDRTTQTAPVKEHSVVGYSEVPATCTQAGTTAGRKCWKCQTVLAGMETIPATGVHDYSVHVEMVHDATCTEKRVDIKKCATCDATKEVESGGLKEHTIVGYAEVPATCIKDGVTAGSKCRICNTVITGMETIPATGVHDYAFVSMVHDATCQEPRLNNYKCNNCDATKQDTTGGLLACNIVEREAVAPTCIEKGKTAGKICTTCGANAACAYCKEITVLQKDVDALGHDHVLVKTNKKVTCTKDGEGVYDCSRCGYDGVVKVIPALGHADVEEILRDATCTRDGWKEVTCSNEGCGKCVTVKIEATGHTEEIVPAVPATCTATGLSEGKKCSVCGEILVAQTVTSMIDHVFETPVDGKPVSCTEDGYTAHMKCNSCDATQGKEEIDTDGHNFVNYVCTKCGTRDGSCNHEGAEVEITAATCTTNGLKKFYCPTCGDEYELVLEATGHTEQVHSTAGTCVAQGKTWSACTVCGQITVPESATGYGSHNYVNNQCTYCGEVNPDSICNHTHGYVTNTEAPTCTMSGSVTATCADCGAVVNTQELPATGHSYNNGVCSACGKRDSSKITSDFQDYFIVG